MKDDILIGDTPKAIRRRQRYADVKSSGRIWKHSGLADIEGLVTRQNIEDCFVLTMVRNPWDRVVSYYHWLREQKFEHYSVSAAKRMTFSEFIFDDAIFDSLKNHPYESYVTDARGTEQCDLFVRLEHVADDLVPFEKHLGIVLSPLQRINKSQRKEDYRAYYGDDDAKRVLDMCKRDIERFDYTF